MNNKEYWEQQERRWIERSGIPRRFWDKTLDDLTITKKNERAIEIVRDYLEPDMAKKHFAEGRGLLFMGPPGSGKTTLACIAAIDLIRHGARTYFRAMSDWQDDLHEQYQPLPEDEETVVRDRVRRAKRSRLLVLDDIGKEYVGAKSKHIEGALDTLLRHRFNHERPTFPTTNLEIGEWGERYGEPMESFLHEAFIIVGLAGHDWRRGGAE